MEPSGAATVSGPGQPPPWTPQPADFRNSHVTRDIRRHPRPGRDVSLEVAPGEMIALIGAVRIGEVDPAARHRRPCRHRFRSRTNRRLRRTHCRRAAGSPIARRPRGLGSGSSSSSSTSSAVSACSPTPPWARSAASASGAASFGAVAGRDQGRRHERAHPHRTSPPAPRSGPGHLSGGQQQRGGDRPRPGPAGAEVILADEPVASLDPVSARRVMDILRKLNRSTMA